MNIRQFLAMATLGAALGITGCGGGGGDGGGTSGTGTSPPTTLSGAAVKGPVNGADVKVFAVRNGAVDRSSPLATGKTASDGSYTVSIPASVAPTGPVIVEISGGTYTDEATGTPGVSLATPLTAIVSSAATGDRISVTPLTQLAYQRALGAGTISSAVIDDANLKIGQIFGVDNIIRSVPFDATQPTAPATATADDKRYASAVGIVSVMAKASQGTKTVANALTDLMAQLGTEVQNTGGFSTATVTALTSATTGFVAINKSGEAAPSVTFTTGVLTLTAAGTLPQGTLINGIDVTVTLPAGATVDADPVTGEVAAGVVTPRGEAATNSLVSGKFTAAAGNTPATLRVILANVQPGFGLGNFAQVKFKAFVPGTYAVSALQVNGSAGSGGALVQLTSVSVTALLSGS